MEMQINVNTKIIYMDSAVPVMRAIENVKRDIRKVCCDSDEKGCDIVLIMENMQAEQFEIKCDNNMLVIYASDTLGFVYGLYHISRDTYVRRLAGAAEMDIGSYDDFKAAMIKRLEFFNQMGCRASDHSLDYAMYVPATAAEIEDIFASALAGEDITYEEDLKFKTAFLLFIGREYKRLGWVMQLHYGVKRDNNSKMFKSFGANAGCDCIDSYTPSAQLADLLNGLQEADALPKTILYSLNPIDNAAIGSVMGCFQHGPEAGYIQQGSAWWFNDNKTGITEQLTSLANQGLLGCFVGMLTDSRSFVSYTRHEYFRRILCNLIGNLVENGEYPYDESTLGKLVEDISYNNTKNYFHFA